MSAGTEPEECGTRPRFWILPVALFGTLLALGATFALLAWAGWVSPPLWSGSYPAFWFVFPLGFLGFWLVVLVVIRPWRWRGSWVEGREWPHRLTPEEVVRIRFARGEISKDEMVRLLRDLDESALPIR